jgi:DNA polymerase delta subunit 1
MINFRHSGADRLKRSFADAIEASGLCNAKFKKPINLEFEKVYHPYWLFSKKRYGAFKYEHLDKPPVTDLKGLGCVRRDGCPFAKSVERGLMDRALKMDKDGMIEFFQKQLDRLLGGRVRIRQLTVSKSLSRNLEDYKQQNSDHLAVVRKMRVRDPMAAPKVGERVAFVFVYSGERAKDGPDKAYLKAEDVNYAVLNSLEIDYFWYWEHQLMTPCMKILGMIHANPEQFYKDIVAKYIVTRKKMREEDAARAAFTIARRAGLPDISKFFKKRSKEDVEKDREETAKQYRQERGELMGRDALMSSAAAATTTVAVSNPSKRARKSKQ